MKKKLIIILAAAFLVRIALIIAFKTYAHPVKWEFEEIINNILAGKGFLYGNFLGAPCRSLTTPLYTYLCAGIYLLTSHSYLAVLLLQALFSLALAAVIFNIAKALFDEDVAFIAAMLVAFHPGYVYYDVFNLVPLSIDSFFITVVTYLFLRFKDRPTASRALLIGGIIGLGALSRGMIGSLLPFLALFLFLFVKSAGFRAKLKLAAFMALAAFIVISPWIIRNYIVQKEFVFIVSTTGENFWRGNNELATGASLTKDGRSILSLWPAAFQEKVRSLDELGQKKFFESEAAGFIKRNPARFIGLYLTKIRYFWWFSDQSGYLYPRSYLVIYKWLYSVMLPFSVAGLLLAVFSGNNATREGALLIVFVLAAVCCMQSFFYVEGRHRWLVEPLVIIFFSSGISKVYRLLFKKRSAYAACG